MANDAARMRRKHSRPEADSILAAPKIRRSQTNNEDLQTNQFLRVFFACMSKGLNKPSVSVKRRHPEQAGGFISKHIPSYILELASIESPSHSLLHALCSTAIQSDCVTVTGWDADHVQLSLCYMIDVKYYCSGSVQTARAERRWGGGVRVRHYCAMPGMQSC